MQLTDPVTKYNVALHFDGQNDFAGSWGGWGFQITRPPIHIDKPVVLASGWGQMQPGPLSTCNVAEWSGLVAGLKCLLQLWYPINRLTIYGDSQLVVRQMAMQYKIKAEHFCRFFADAQYLLHNITKNHYELEWIPREQNQEADRLSNVGRKCGKSEVFQFAEGLQPKRKKKHVLSPTSAGGTVVTG